MSKDIWENRVTLGQWKNCKIPEKLYHITLLDNVFDIMEFGLKTDAPEKMFKNSRNVIYLGTDINFCEDYMVNLFAEALANKFESLDDIRTIEVKFMVFEIETKNLEKIKLNIDELLEPHADNEYILSFTYDDNINREYVHLLPTLYSQKYIKEELIEYFNKK